MSILLELFETIVATKRESHYVLDEILGNATDVPVTEARDGHAWVVTLVNFGLFDLLGLQLSPRIPLSQVAGEGLPVRRQQRSGRVGHGCCPCEGEIEIRWVMLARRVRRAESGTRGLSADADRAPIRFPRRARLYV